MQQCEEKRGIQNGHGCAAAQFHWTLHVAPKAGLFTNPAEAAEITTANQRSGTVGMTKKL
jgi:hypothetical protein